MNDDIAGLLEQALNGEQSAWDTLVDRFNDALWSWARRAGLPPQAAEDVVQVTWLRLLEHGHAIEEPNALGGWLRTTLVREARRSSSKDRGHHPLDGADTTGTADTSVGPELAAVVGDRDRRLWAAVDSLGDRCRQLLTLLTEDPPTSYQQISTRLEMPVGSIGSARSSCLKQLRRLMEQQGFQRV